jgi:hypothetical protein
MDQNAGRKANIAYEVVEVMDTDHVKQASDLVSEHYGAWSTMVANLSVRAGQRVRLSPAAIRRELLPDDASAQHFHLRATSSGSLIGHLFDR